MFGVQKYIHAHTKKASKNTVEVTHCHTCVHVSEGSKRDISSTNEVADPHDLRRFMKLQKTWATHDVLARNIC